MTVVFVEQPLAKPVGLLKSKILLKLWGSVYFLVSLYLCIWGDGKVCCWHDWWEQLSRDFTSLQVLHKSTKVLTSYLQIYKSLRYFFTGLPNFLHQTQSVWREEGGKSPVGEMVARQGEIKGSQTCGRENVHCTVIWLTCTVCRFQWQYTVYRRQRDFYVVLTVCQEPFRMYSAGYTIHATMPPTVGCSGGIKDAIYCNKKLTPLFLSLLTQNIVI